MLSFGKQRPAHSTAGDVAALSSELATLSTAVGLLATKRDVQNLPDSSSELATLSTAVSLLATKQDVQNLPDLSSELAAINSTLSSNQEPVLTEVQLQTNYKFPYLAVCGSNGAVHKLQENSLLAVSASYDCNELLAPFSLYLDARYRWKIVAVGEYQEFNFASSGLVVDYVNVAQQQNYIYTYDLPESLVKENGSNRWNLHWSQVA